MAGIGLCKTSPLSFEGKCAEKWRIFEQEYAIFIAAAYSDKEDATKAAVLFNLAGLEAIERERTFTYHPARANPAGGANPPAESRQSPAVLNENVEKKQLMNKCVILERQV